jgi:hypothetical protein
MATKLLPEKYRDQIYGMLECYDRIIITGTLPGFCYPEGMTAYLHANHIKIFDYAKQFAMPLCEKIRAQAKALEKANHLEIEFVRKSTSRKEARIKQILKTRGTHPGLVYIFSAMERCSAFRPWYDKNIKQAQLKYADGKCLHYYFYFIDEELGLCYFRVPTWAPFRLQFYCNGHNLLASQLKRKGIAYEMQDNAFLNIVNFDKANQLAQQLDINKLHRKLDKFATQYYPVIKTLMVAYHWSTMQAELATDIIFKRQKDLQAIYNLLLLNYYLLRSTGEYCQFPGAKTPWQL